MAHGSILAPAQYVVFFLFSWARPMPAVLVSIARENSAPVPVFLGYPRRRRLVGNWTAHADKLGTLEMIGGIGRRRS